MCSGVGTIALEDLRAAASSTPTPTPAKAEFPAAGPVPEYDWTKHRWAFGVDVTRCIGCLRCVEACKVENKSTSKAKISRASTPNRIR